MNFILFEPSELLTLHTASIEDPRRIKHILEVHQGKLGDEFKVGLINGEMGSGIISALSDKAIVFDVTLAQLPPQALSLTLILALPRPKMLRRIFQTIATLGVKKLYLINSYRVEKSYWQSPFLQAEAIRHQLILGLEQGGDTLLPEVNLIKRFKPFLEDELPRIIKGTRALVAHPYTDEPCPRAIDYPVTLAVGPEGGFIDYEIELLKKCGFNAVHLGARIMRVETAIPYLLGRLY